MKISLNWASHWTKVPDYSTSSLEDFSHKYSTYTAEVEGIDSYVFDEKIVVGHVTSWKPHPDSDKLGLVSVDAGICGQHEIVCGAPNAKTAQYVPVALEHALLPNGLEITKRNIRGIDSCGMICSLDELGLQASRAEGIFPLETVWDKEVLEKHLGKPFGALSLIFPGHDGDIVYPMDDVVFDLDNKFITNRPDLFSVVGNAREIACIEKSTFNFASLGKGRNEGISFRVDEDEVEDYKNNNPPSIPPLSRGRNLNVNIESDKVVNYFLTEYTLPDVPVSPFLIQTLLKRSNQGTHGLLPDLTNIVMTEIGQPMHVFDADTVVGGIVLRMAKKGESFSGLDGKEYSLTSEDLVIVDDEKVLALAGIMGGKSSGASETTKRIFIESATFDAITVRKTSQRLGIRTDSSVRFEKGVDVTLARFAQMRYVQLLEFFIPGVKKENISLFETAYVPREISLTLEAIIRKIGKEVTEKEVTDILTRLGFVTTINNQQSTINAVVPSWRNTGDVTLPVDVIEEIARHVGYEHIECTPLPGPLATVHVHSHDTITKSVTQFFSEMGYMDAYTYPFTLAERFERFSQHTPAIIRNTSENRTHLRAHLAENLLELVASHYRKEASGGFFEFGPIFDGVESLQGCGVLWGKSLESLQKDLTSFMLTYFGNAGIRIQGDGNFPLFAPNAYGEIKIAQDKRQKTKDKMDDFSGDEVVVRFGLVRPTLLPMFGIEGIDVYAFEIIKMPESHRAMKCIPLVEFPGTRRELNFIMPENTPVGLILADIASVHDWISDIGVSEIYRDETHIGKDKKSVVISFLIRNREATITDDEARAIQNQIIANLAEKGYVLRGM